VSVWRVPGSNARGSRQRVHRQALPSWIDGRVASPQRRLPATGPRRPRGQSGGDQTHGWDTAYFFPGFDAATDPIYTRDDVDVVVDADRGRPFDRYVAYFDKIVRRGESEQFGAGAS
jgi:hypothetical protein